MKTNRPEILHYLTFKIETFMIKIILLLSLTATLNAQNINEKIIAASREGKIEDLNTYLKSDSADLNYKDQTGYTALDYAVEWYQLPAFIRLIEYTESKSKNADSNSEVEKLNQFVFAILQNDSSKISNFLTDGINVNQKHHSGYYPLSLAIRWHFIPITEMLLKNGAKVNVRNTNRYNTTPLMEATRNGSVRVGKLLIKYGAEINVGDINNDPAINWAVFFGYTDFVKLLLDNGSRSDMKGIDSGDDAMAIAKRLGHTDIIKLLESSTK